MPEVPSPKHPFQASSQDAEGYATLSTALLEKYSTRGPRYTSYPTVPVWTNDFDEKHHTEALKRTNRPDYNGHQADFHGHMPFSIYTHLPFCEARCLFCSCNVVITKQRDQAKKYLDYLFRDIDHHLPYLDLSRPVTQFHWGGGTPTYLSPEQMGDLFAFYKERFLFSPDAEIAVEVDPRVTSKEHLQALREFGFNRVSLGLQDVEPAVQEAVHRIQSADMTERMMQSCRELGFGGINLDLIYGLPHQTVDSFKNTLEVILKLNPDRIALYNYAHVPWMSPHQNLIPESTLPTGDVKLQIFQLGIRTLTEAGYVYIGMDHFAKPTDELTLAMKEGTLHRNFMGYTVRAGQSDLLGFGVSAISDLQGYYAQNHRKLSDYYDAVDAKELPTMRGCALTAEDKLRSKAILSILCQGELNRPALANAFHCVESELFQTEFKALESLAKDTLIEWTDTGFRVTDLGRIFSRNIAMPFDAYLKPETTSVNNDSKDAPPMFSKTL
jgi:oxygen-independent coproporphyrinogen III oxidase